MRTLMQRVARIAAASAPVIIVGESGSGKEVLARMLHANSARRGRPLVTVHASAAPTDLLEADLFGSVRGGVAKPGLFETADGGMLFLDELAELPLGLQAALVRVLEEGQIRRAGDGRPSKVDVRLLCATSQDLEACVAERTLRRDLYFRLRVFTLAMPPLRERGKDILPLARMFLGQEGHATGRFTRAAEEALLGHRWPGNVRELANAVQHAAIFSDGANVDVAHLPDEIVRPSSHDDGRASLQPLVAIEREHVARVLAACGGRQGDAARILGIGRTTLWRKLQALGIEAVGGPASGAQYRKFSST